ncbi:hypothetical protein SCA6_002726 [Theobroma cacao]
MMYFDFLIYEFHTAYKSPALFFIPPTGISICLIPTNSDHKKLNPTQGRIISSTHYSQLVQCALQVVRVSCKNFVIFWKVKYGT